jgi:hypothetical protein
MADDERIEALQREIEALKRAMAPTEADRAAAERRVAEHRDWAHQLAEQRMAHAAPFTREDIAAFDRACPLSVSQDIAARGGIPGPSTAGAGGTISSIHSDPGLPGSHRGTGWRDAGPIGPPPGVAAADRLMDAADARDRADLIAQEARRMAMMKLAEPK